MILTLNPARIFCYSLSSKGRQHARTTSAYLTPSRCAAAMSEPFAAQEVPVKLYSHDIEKALLGAILLDGVYFERVRLSPEDFHLVKHQWIWSAMQRSVEAGSYIGLDQVAEQLKQAGKLDEAGGLASLLEILNRADTLNVTANAQTLQTYTAQRKRHALLHSALNQNLRGETLDLHKFGEALRALNEEIAWDTWKLFTLEDAFQEREPTRYLVGKLLPIPSVNIWFGFAGTLKSMLLMDQAVCIAGGMDWLQPAPWKESDPTGMKTDPVPTMWLDFDQGTLLTHERFAALCRWRDIPTHIPLYYYSMPHPWLDATDPGSIEAMILRAREWGVHNIYIDNLGVISGGADENSAEMIKVMSGLRHLSEGAEAAVNAIHHSRKSNGFNSRTGETMRGHSSIEAMIDMSFEVVREAYSDLITVKPAKMRRKDVLPFSAVWTYEDNDNDELVSAGFFGTEAEDDQSNTAIDREINLALMGTVMNKTDLATAVKKALNDVGVNRIRNRIDRLTAAKKLIRSQGSKTEQLYRRA